MERKYTIKDFAEIVGTTPKTIYSRLDNESNLPDNERLIVVNEKVRGRETRFVVTNSEQIQLYKNIFGKYTDNIGNYEDILTDNEEITTVNNIQNRVKNNNNDINAQMLIEHIMNVNEEQKKELKEVNDQLITYKSKTLLLEDKEHREGYYINEINELKTDNNQLMKANNLLKYVIMGLITVIVITFTWLITVNNISKPVTEQEVEQVAPKIVQPTPTEAKAPVKAVKKR